MDANNSISLNDLDFNELNASLKVWNQRENCELGRLYRRVMVVKKVPPKKIRMSKGSRRRFFPLGAFKKHLGRIGKTISAMVIRLPPYEDENEQEQRIESLCDNIQKVNIKRTRSESESSEDHQECKPMEVTFTEVTQTPPQNCS